MEVNVTKTERDKLVCMCVCFRKYGIVRTGVISEYGQFEKSEDILAASHNFFIKFYGCLCLFVCVKL